ncbi:MAG: TlpA family protein disulfide reductase [Candidatus Rokubacteria bacterium]|nr:TlpA family protein disulfide reductase [Candidatus Rokubacteria bacterium]
MPSLISVAKSFGERGLRLVLVNLGEDRELVERVARERRYDAPILIDRAGEARRVFGVHATPTVFVLDREGRVVGGAVGPHAWTGPPARALLDALLARPTPS